MIYFVNWDGDMSLWPSWYGILRSPRRYATGILKRERDRVWIGDNDAFHGLFEPDIFTEWLFRMKPFADRCKFIACPDVVGDSVATTELWCRWANTIWNAGFTPAFVVQDGQDPDAIPGIAEALFIGGTTKFKMGARARDCIAEGRQRKAWVHVGRVNSQKRIAYFQSIGADSADGTTINRGPLVKSRLLSAQLSQRPLGLTLEATQNQKGDRKP